MLDTLQHKTSGAALLEKFIETQPQAAALAIESIPLNEAVFWFSSLNMESIVLCFEQMNPKKAAPILRRLPLKQAIHILSKLNADTAAALVVNLPAPYRAKMTASMDKRLNKTLEEVLSYPKDSAARLMRTNFVTFKTDTKVKEIISRIKMMPRNKMPHNLFVLDKGNKLAGVIRTMELALANDESLAGSVMNPQFAKISPLDKKTKVLALFRNKHYLNIPVVDNDGYLLGVINTDDLINTITSNKFGGQRKGLLQKIKSRLSL